MKDASGDAIAEFLATLTFFFLAFVVVAKTGLPPGLVWGASLGVAVLFFGGFNAAHANPAVTLGMWAGGRMSWYAALMYWIAQLSASLVGLLVATFFVTQSFERAFARQYIVWRANDVGAWTVIAYEAGATFFLTLAVAAGTDNRSQRWASWLLIGGTLGFFVWLIGAQSGGAVNPVRALAPFVVVWPENGLFGTFLFYVFGPLMGGLAAGVIYRTFRGPA